MAVEQLGSQGQFLYRLRHFNKASFNRLTLMFAGRYVYAAVHHIGCRSGHAFTTPVFAFQNSEGFITPLPFGTATDWCRNVLAAGKCIIQYRGVSYAVNQPEVIAAETAHPFLPAWARLLLRPIPIRQFLKVKKIATT
jgi:hypothetical protein